MTAPNCALPALPAYLQPSVGPFADEYARLCATDPVLAHHVLSHAVRILGGGAPEWTAAARAVLAAPSPEVAALLEDEALGGAEYVLAYARRALAVARAGGAGAGGALKAACVAFAVAEGLGPLSARDAQDAATAAQMYTAAVTAAPVTTPAPAPVTAPAPAKEAPKHEAPKETVPDLQSMFPAIPAKGTRPHPKPAHDEAALFPQIPGKGSKQPAQPPAQPPAQSDNDVTLSSLFPAIPGAKKKEEVAPAPKPAAPAAKGAAKPKSTEVRGQKEGGKEKEKYAGAKKACRFADSALNFDDSKTAVAQILLALRELTGKDYVPQ